MELKSGWVLQRSFDKKFWTDEDLCDVFYDADIKFARVYEDRRLTRIAKEAGEVIRKVSLTPEGVPIEIIGRG